MGKHRRPTRLQKQVAVAVPAVVLGACLITTSSSTTVSPVADTLTPARTLSTTALTAPVPEAWYVTQYKTKARPVVSKTTPHVKNPVKPVAAVKPVPTATVTTPAAPAPVKVPAPVVHNASFNANVVAAANTQIGVPYVYGGDTPGVALDCSSLTQYAYSKAGHWIPRVADDQFHYFTMIPKSAARPGDLVFFHDSTDPESYVYHVGVYIGGSDMMVVAPDTGLDVQVQNFDWGGNTVTFGTLDIH